MYLILSSCLVKKKEEKKRKKLLKMNCTVLTLKNNSFFVNKRNLYKCFVHLCFHSDGGGPPGGGIPVHHNTRGDWPAAVLSGPEPDLPVRSAIMEETSQPHEGKDYGKSLVCVFDSVWFLSSYFTFMRAAILLKAICIWLKVQNFLYLSIT